MSLQGKVALITGGASGLGKHLAEELNAQGVIVIIADIQDAPGEAFVASLNERRKGSAFFHKADVTSWDEQVKLFKAILEDVKRIDYVFANAGMLESPYLAATSSEAAQWVKPDLTTININVTGVLYTANLATQVFRTQPLVDGFRGKIVVTASVASFTNIPYLPLYSTSKHALVGFVRAFGAQLADEGITVNGVAPNITRSNLAPAVVFDTVAEQGRLTSNDSVTQAFISFLGDNKDTGLIKEVSLDQTFVRPLPEPLNPQVTENVNFLSGAGKAQHDAAAA